MTTQREILAIVPARGGSVGIPRKNLRELAGRPLVAWAVAAAFDAAMVTRVVCSTDDAEIAGVAREAGAEVPFIRPAELAANDTPDLPVLLHTLQELAADGYRPEAVAWLRPTAPLVLGADVDAAVELLLGTGADAVRSVCEAEHHPYWTRRLDGDRLVPLCGDGGLAPVLRRQSLPSAFRLNGAVDVVLATAVPSFGGPFDAGDVRGYVMPRERSIDIDDEFDLQLAELVLARRS